MLKPKAHMYGICDVRQTKTAVHGTVISAVSDGIHSSLRIRCYNFSYLQPLSFNHSRRSFCHFATYGISCASPKP